MAPGDDLTKMNAQAEGVAEGSAKPKNRQCVVEVAEKIQLVMKNVEDGGDVKGTGSRAGMLQQRLLGGHPSLDQKVDAHEIGVGLLQG